MEAKGYCAHAADKALEPFTFQRRTIRDDDVLIDIKFCGICHSDIHSVRNEWGGAKYPVVPGHEIVGVVRSVGKAVTKFKAGDKVGVGCMVDTRSDAQPLENIQYSSGGMVMTYASDDREGQRTQGGYSNIIVVRDKFVVRVPDNLSLDAVAPLLCAGITLYSPLKHWNAGPGKKVAILGMGGLGHIGIKIASAMGAEVTVISQTMSKQADGLKFGAKDYYATSDPETFKTLARRFDLIISTLSEANVDWNGILGALKAEGTLVLLGAPAKPIPLPVMPLLFGRRSVAGSLIGDIPETQEMLDFCAKHNIVSNIETIPIQKVNEAYERVLKSDVRYRFVIDISTL
jgi:uncharacterized zinc-type alcohol dehydrogenase-like protein